MIRTVDQTVAISSPSSYRARGQPQCFQIFGFQIFGFGFPNIFNTSDFEYRIRSFICHEKIDKKSIVGKKNFDGQMKFWYHTILLV